MGMMSKPRAVEKFRNFFKSVKKNGDKIGISPRVLDFCYINVCNFKCEHCFTRAPQNPQSLKDVMPLEKVKDVMDQADELGIYELDLQGGELLLFPDKLFELAKAVGSERFYLYLTTNGYFLDEKMAYRLAEAGFDRISVSIDSIESELHDSFRGFKGAHEHALAALEYVRKAGMDPFLNCTVGHFNAKSAKLEELLNYSYQHGYTTILNIAAPTGSWEGNSDVVVDAEDLQNVQRLREKYPNITRDIWDPFDKERKNILGCNCVNLIYMTPAGDILPCPFVHIKLGNVYEQSLKDILDYGFSVKYFGKYQKLCLAAEDRDFINNYLNQPKSIYKPLDAKTLFKDSDYIKEVS